MFGQAEALNFVPFTPGADIRLLMWHHCNKSAGESFSVGSDKQSHSDTSVQGPPTWHSQHGYIIPVDVP